MRTVLLIMQCALLFARSLFGRGALPAIQYSPHRARTVVRYKQGAIGTNGNSHRPAPDVALRSYEPGHEVFVLTVRYAVLEWHAYNLIAARTSPCPMSLKPYPTSPCACTPPVPTTVPTGARTRRTPGSPCDGQLPGNYYSNMAVSPLPETQIHHTSYCWDRYRVHLISCVLWQVVGSSMPRLSIQQLPKQFHHPDAPNNPAIALKPRLRACSSGVTPSLSAMLISAPCSNNSCTIR